MRQKKDLNGKHRKKEIGSEFELSNDFMASHNSFFNSFQLTFSGRTSMQLALMDIMKYQTINDVWFPSYCCSSMITPALDLNLDLKFYAVNYNIEKGMHCDYFYPKDNDVIVLMDYFGFEIGCNITNFKSDKNIYVIEDQTHSLLSYKGKSSADYVIASIRKWFPIVSGGIIRKKTTDEIPCLKRPSQEFVAAKLDAMEEKKFYLDYEDINIKKEEFLRKYSNCNREFESSYANRNIDVWSENLIDKIDIDGIIARRRKNAATLINGLRGINGVQTLVNNIKENEIPLFVPIVSKKRDSLISYLIEKNIYCPVHWPKPDEKANSNLYNTEISLVCDQRYDEGDMERIIDTINKWAIRE